MSTQQSSRSKEKGITLVEIMFATVIFLIFIIGAIKMITSSSNSAVHSRNAEQAVRLCQEGVEKMEAIDYDFLHSNEGDMVEYYPPYEYNFGGGVTTTTIYPIGMITIGMDSTAKRSVRIEDVDDSANGTALTDIDGKKVIVFVRWKEGRQNKERSVATVIYEK